ncbi:MAG: DUF177 domain-containing protein [Actinomycetota bacterium]
MAGLRMNVSDLLKTEGAEKSLKLEVDIPAIKKGEERIELAKAPRLDLGLRNVGNRILASGSLRGEVFLDCSRCLIRFKYPMEIGISELFRKPGEFREEKLPVEEERAFAIVNDEIDLAPMAEQAMLLFLPMKPLCKQVCKGLCPVCGENLNKRPHVHEGEEIDSRLIALKKLLKKK